MALGEFIKTLCFELSQEDARKLGPKGAMELARAHLAVIQGQNISTQRRATLQREFAAKYDPRAEIEEANRARFGVARGSSKEMAERPDERRAPADGPRQVRPWTRREEMEPRSPRFMDPASYTLKPGVAADTAGTGARGGRFGLNGPAPIQNFYGGFDEQAVARRAQLEANSAVRGAQARALHDVGRPL